MKTSLSLSAKKERSVLAKLSKFKNVHPSGVSSSPCPLTCSPSPPLDCNLSCHKNCCHKPSLTGRIRFAPIASAPPSEAPEEQKFPSVFSPELIILIPQTLCLSHYCFRSGKNFQVESGLFRDLFRGTSGLYSLFS